MTESCLQFNVDTSRPERIDRWLTRHLPDLSRSHIQKLIEQGHVWVNDRTCTTKNSQINGGDRIQITIPESEPLSLEPEPIPLDVLYEDEQLIIINKPADMVVHPSVGHEHGTLVNALLAHCHDLAGIGGVMRPGIVHRLDKDTTGAIVVAKTDLALLHVQQQIQTKTAQRNYLAVVYGAPAEEMGTIEQPIGRHPVDRKKMAVVTNKKGGRYAVTHWRVLERLGNYSLLHFRLETGRTHQIRVHSTYMGHPIVGDRDYGSGRSVGVNLPGQALHAWQLRLYHPITGEPIEAIAPLPLYFEKLLGVLRRRV